MKKYIYGFLFLALVAVGCTDSFEELNIDPDRPSDVLSTNLLANVLRYHANTSYDTWGDMNEPSSYGGHIAKIQYIDESKYEFRPGTVESNWQYIYITLNNINEIQKKAISEATPNMMAVAQVMKVKLMLEATDLWRDVPFTEATRLDEGILLPKYDTQETIYPALLDTLASAADRFDVDADALGEGDFLYGGDIVKWQKYCNSMRLRIAMRISGVAESTAKSVIETVAGNSAKYPVMESNDDNAFFWWQGSSPYSDPWYEDFEGRDDYSPSDILVDRLKNTNDPRLSVYAHPAEEDGEYRGFTIGAVAQPALPTISRIGSRFREDAAGFSPFMRYAEVELILAEAALKGWSVGKTAEEAYTAGVTASLEENSVAVDEITNYLAADGAFSDMESIYYQRWIALFKQGREVWAFYRRTGIPSEHYIAPGTSYTGHNTPPLRYPYPDNESTLNGANSKAFVAEVNDDFWGKPMWWDTRTGVK